MRSPFSRFARCRRASSDLGFAPNVRASRDAVALLGFALILKTVAEITTRTVSPKSDAHVLSRNESKRK